VSYRLTVLGTGYLGTAQAACLASAGFDVLGVDTDPDRIAALSRGLVPFHEPGLESLLRKGLAAGQFFSEQLRLLAPDTELAWCPEFLREGHAVQDTLTPDRVVVGVQSARAEAILRDVHAAQIATGTPFLVTDLATAELVKVAANAFLATKISFINAMAEVCEAAHGDVQLLAEALGHDSRIGPAGLRPGLGFGGGCLPKDIRDSPALDVARTIRDLGAAVTVYDPVAMPAARRAHPELRYAESAVEAAQDADVMLVLTEWDEFREADPEILGKVVNKRNIVDGRNALDPARWREASWHYRALGRP
jgi:UDPglucose 6-dehydrogenase